MPELPEDIIVHSPEHVDVRSESDPRFWHRVNPLAGTCDCKGYYYRKGCSHLKRVAQQTDLFSEYQEDLPDDLLSEVPEIFTSRYMAQKVLASGLVVPIRISMYPPIIPLSYEVRYAMPELMPERAMDGPWNKYSSGMWHKLERVGAERIAKKLAKISKDEGGKALALLCYEDITKPTRCHRVVFSFFFQDASGLTVPELTNEGELLTPEKFHREVLPIRGK